ncbi:MG2 domain-containing protein [Chitinophaga japonensis]|uniref:MG2 domain-containing protein n=1 Tax=Chitinophaga japonensis TaxID=104662 RepID=A0A562T6N9_CHIJA|nr:MG2 domain-containing protein [Chitinophaga japonensis]TWI88938.1 MG2 domain-containing protein [Chitinophaga japonensis]
MQHLRTLLKLLRLQWWLPACVLIILCAFTFKPADHWSDRIVQALEEFAGRYPQQKVYLHLDKDYYAAGETVWFKAYLTLQGLPDTRAANLYVELLDKNGALVQKKLFAVGNAGAAGNIDLPETQKPGMYQIRAYTSWMLNFDHNFLYYRTIEVFDPRKNNPAPRDSARVTDFSVQFFPEGGDLIKGQPNQVAFKAVDQNGYPIAVSGSVQNGKGEKVAEIRTIHDGMGAFDLAPPAGATYRAQVKAANGQEKTFELPAVKTSGVGLKVYNRGLRVFYQALIANPEDTAYDDLVIIGQMGQQLVYKAPLKVSEGRISGFVPTQYMPSGIMQLTLFSKRGEPLAERLAFVRKMDLLPLHIEETDLDKEGRTKNTLILKVPDSLSTILSVSVTDADLVQQDPDQNNIVSNLLLTSDLKGYIHNPAWYFRDTTQATLHALDLVMMTNGWRRFSWQQILNNQFPSTPFEYEQGIMLKGTAFTNNGRFQLMNGKVDFIIKQVTDSSTVIASAPTNAMGEFSIPNLSFLDTALVYYQGNDQQKRWKDVTVKFNTHFFENTAPVTVAYPLRLPPKLDNSVLKDYLATADDGNRVRRSISSRAILLREVNITERKIRQEESLEKRYATGLFAGGDGYTFDMTKENNSYMNIFQYLQSRVAGLQITGNLNDPSLMWRGGRPALYLNEMPSDASMLSGIPVTDIAMVKVFRPPFMGGFGGANGAIAVYTKKGGEGGDDSMRGFELYRKPGYAVVKEFYSPDYALHKEVHSLPDKRLTLYWNPNLPVDTLSHTARISFYNNDFTTHFRVVVEGIGADGSVGRVEQVY